MTQALYAHMNNKKKKEKKKECQQNIDKYVIEHITKTGTSDPR
jgi:hypothetical protein